MVVIGLVAVGRETFRSAAIARPAVFDLAEAVDFVADDLDDAPASRLTPDDVKWALLFDLAQIESATVHAEDLSLGRGLLDDEAAVDVLAAEAERTKRDICRDDLVAIVRGRTRYLQAIGAIGPRAD